MWSGITDSNRGQKLGRLLCYHYTNPACGALRRAVPEEQSGRGDRIRTCDPLVPNQVRYRPALRLVKQRAPEHYSKKNGAWYGAAGRPEAYSAAL